MKYVILFFEKHTTRTTDPIIRWRAVPRVSAFAFEQMLLSTVNRAVLPCVGGGCHPMLIKNTVSTPGCQADRVPQRSD